MRILILADARPGHLRQCTGLAQIIGRKRPVEVTELPVRTVKWAGERVRTVLAAMRWPDPARLLRRVYRIEAPAVSGYDLVIGSGRPTILAGMLIARMTGARFVYCGRAADYDHRDIALLLVPYEEERLMARHAVVPIPTMVVPDLLPPPRALDSLAALEGAHVALMVGGPSSSRSWSVPEWGDLGQLLIYAELAFKIRWSIATSRRTPDAARALLAMSFAALEHGERWIDFQDNGPGSADPLWAADALCVTSDSTSMIAEGLAAMRPVVGIASHRQKTTRDDRMLGALGASGSFVELDLAGLTPDRLANALIGLKPPSADPRDVILAALEPVLAGIG